MFLKSTAWRALGLALIAFALSILVSLISYNPADPTINNEAAREATNWLGAYGANIADVFMQTLALAAYLLPVPIALWGFKLLWP